MQSYTNNGNIYRVSLIAEYSAMIAGTTPQGVGHGGAPIYIYIYICMCMYVQVLEIVQVEVKGG